MLRSPSRIGALAVACLIAAVPSLNGAHGQSDTSTAAPRPKSDIFNPDRAPEIVIHVGARRIALTRHSGDSTTLTAKAIEKKANSSSFSNIIASSVPGAAQSSSGELHIRGSHGQYTYYLDGAPLPSSISGSFSDLIDPKNIETLHVYTGGFPARAMEATWPPYSMSPQRLVRQRSPPRSFNRSCRATARRKAPGKSARASGTRRTSFPAFGTARTGVSIR